MAVIFALSAQPSLPKPPGGMSDKQEHALAYAGLSALACRAIAGGPLVGLSPSGALAAAVIASAYGITDELHQSFVPGRKAEVADWVADAAGAAAAALGAWAWGIIARSRRTRRRTAPPA
jgi:VanZ family protein